MTYYYTRQCQS